MQPAVGIHPAASRWLVLAGCALLATCTQLLWLTFAPITTEAAGALRGRSRPGRRPTFAGVLGAAILPARAAARDRRRAVLIAALVAMSVPLHGHCHPP